MIYQKIRTLEIELSSSCNAGCVVCPRFIQHDRKLYENPHANLNEHLTPDMIDDIMTGFPMEDRVRVDLIGTVGDPLSNKDVVEIVRRIVQHKPDCIMQIHTNGSLRRPDTFEALAELMPFRSRRKIVFSFDGLEDTNHLYRRNVDWNKALANAQAFIRAGGHAQWKMIEFSHNRHQLELARDYARHMGFKTFELAENQSPDFMIDDAIDHSMEIVKRAPTAEDGYADDDPIEPIVPAPIEAQCELGQYIHIRGDGKVFPCCMTAAADVNPTSWIRDDVNKLMQGDDNWNWLHKHSFADIMFNPKWLHVQNGYKRCESYTCVDCCAVDSEMLNKPDHIHHAN